MTFLAIWGAPGPQVFHARAAPTPPVTQPGAVDDRISDTAFRRRKKRRIEALTQPDKRVVASHIVVTAPIPAKPRDFRTLAQLSGKSVEIFRAEVDQEIAQLLADEQERDDEEALTLILTALED